MLCALDLGLTDGVNRATAELVQRGVVGAVSCLTISDIWPQTAPMLSQLRSSGPPDLKIGLSIRLTGAFSPLTAGFAPENALRTGSLPDLDDFARAARGFALNDKLIEAECRAQLRRFTAHAGYGPQFIVLDETMLLFGAAAKALSATLAKFGFQDMILLCPVVPKPRGWIERVKQKWLWGSQCHLSKPWQRRQLVEPQSVKQLPPQASWRLDGQSWSAVRPAYDDERLARFDQDPERRTEQLGWFAAP
ncbi:ChbG/HpnK family deacetylase [Cohaesibacter celericrescens]|uniref:ChbG/HpnK family deacetylase n=1 Tax=Cohaesibacter celericrescens TaxID=2067669 RepID=UPI0024782DA9|nr:ChbG/HpnK family deacetylase [Cohaesibacter celericrescens]